MSNEFCIDPNEYSDWLKDNCHELTSQEIDQMSAEFEKDCSEQFSSELTGVSWGSLL